VWACQDIVVKQAEFGELKLFKKANCEPYRSGLRRHAQAVMKLRKEQVDFFFGTASRIAVARLKEIDEFRRIGAALLDFEFGKLVPAARELAAEKMVGSLAYFACGNKRLLCKQKSEVKTAHAGEKSVWDLRSN